MKIITAKNEIEVSVRGAHIVNAFITSDGKCRLTVESDKTSEQYEEASKTIEPAIEPIVGKTMFTRVEASKLSLNDCFMCHNPTTCSEELLRDDLVKLIKRGLKDFYRPVMDPSFGKHRTICYVKRKKPAVGKTCSWWLKKAINYMPERGSRLGTSTEYISFLGVLIKKLVYSGWEVSSAWDAVCNDSYELGYYPHIEHVIKGFELTGSREMVGYYDLGNTLKILADDGADRFWLAGGRQECGGPLADLTYWKFPHTFISDGVGWIVLEK